MFIGLWVLKTKCWIEIVGPITMRYLLNRPTNMMLEKKMTERKQKLRFSVLHFDGVGYIHSIYKWS